MRDGGRRFLTGAFVGLAVVCATAGQRFRTGTDLVLIDVAVVDRSGEPVTDLRATDFTVSVAGKPRPIQSVEFVGTRRDTVPEDAPAKAREAGVTTNTRPASGRLLLIAIDESHLSFGSSQAVLRTAATLMDRLAPGDPVAVSRIPDGGGVEFTTDRARVRDALQRLTIGSRQTPQMTVRVYLSEAVDFDAGSRYEFPRAIVRECGDDPTRAGYAVCVTDMRATAKTMLVEESIKTTNVLQAIERMVAGLEGAEAPVTIVLISEGIYLGSETGLMSQVSRAGATSRVTLHVVKPLPPSVDMRETGSGPISPSVEESLRREGPSALAAVFGGEVYSVAGTGEGAFERIGAELSGYYLMAIDATDDDRKSERRALRVEVKGRNVSVRARKHFSVRPPANTRAADARPALQRLLSSVVPNPGLAMKVATYTALDPASGRVRLLVSAEVGGAVSEATRQQVGLLILSDKGEVVANTMADATLAPSRAGVPSPGLYVVSIPVAEGHYSLRLGSITAGGQLGSIHHPVHAASRVLPGRFRASDLIVAAATPAGGAPRFTPSAVVDGDRVAALVEVGHDDPSRLARADVRFEVIQRSGGPTVSRIDGTSSLKSDGKRREFSGVVPLVGMPAGEYILRAVIDAGGEGETTIERRFRLEPRAVVSTATAPALRPTADQFLSPSLVRWFVDDLDRRYPVSAALKEFVAAAKAGRFDTPPDAETRPAADIAMVTFVGGLSALRAGKTAVAQVLFDYASQKATGVPGGDFYAGACHAITGDDRRAVEAWLKASAAGAADLVSPFIVDAQQRAQPIP